MRAVILGLFMTLGLAAHAQEKPAVEAVIESQIDAFLADDFAEAFTYAAPNIKRMFGTAQRFGAMVRQGYPMVYRPAEVTFLELEESARRVVQKVMIRDADGVFHVLEYHMVDSGSGWQISGVRVLEAQQLGV